MVPYNVLKFAKNFISKISIPYSSKFCKFRDLTSDHENFPHEKCSMLMVNMATFCAAQQALALAHASG